MSKNNLVELHPKDNLVEPYPNVIECSECGSQEWIIHTKPGSTPKEFAIDFLECSDPDCGECFSLDVQMIIEPEDIESIEEEG